MSDGLFDLDPAQVRINELADQSAQRRLTLRQKWALDKGQHPLSLLFGHMPLHDEAAPVGSRAAEGRRCRNCIFHELWGAHSYPKCSLGDGVRRSHGAGTDCRGWWPACRDHKYESEAGDA